MPSSLTIDCPFALEVLTHIEALRIRRSRARAGPGCPGGRTCFLIMICDEPSLPEALCSS